jgi:nitrite reductase (NADH) small subunit
LKEACVGMCGRREETDALFGLGSPDNRAIARPKWNALARQALEGAQVPSSSLSGVWVFDGISASDYTPGSARNWCGNGVAPSPGQSREVMAFVRAVAAADIAAGTIREVDVNGKLLAVANVGGTFHAIDNTCLHRGGPLGDGPLEGNVVTCPWHGWQYDVTTGKVSQNPSVGVACYPVEIRAGEVYVDLG